MTAKRIPLFVSVVVVGLLVVFSPWLVTAYHRHMARSGQRYVNAIFAFHEKTRRYPSSLQELVPTFINKAPANDVVNGWDYRTGPDNSGHGFTLSKHGLLPHSYVEYQSSGIVEDLVPPPPAGWVENFEGSITELDIEPDGAANRSQPVRSGTNQASGAAGSGRLPLR
jgi:hypothetical protein